MLSVPVFPDPADVGELALVRYSTFTVVDTVLLTGDRAGERIDNAEPALGVTGALVNAYFTAPAARTLLVRVIPGPSVDVLGSVSGTAELVELAAPMIEALAQNRPEDLLTHLNAALPKEAPHA